MTEQGTSPRQWFTHEGMLEEAQHLLSLGREVPKELPAGMLDAVMGAIKSCRFAVAFHLTQGHGRQAAQKAALLHLWALCDSLRREWGIGGFSDNLRFQLSHEAEGIVGYVEDALRTVGRMGENGPIPLPLTPAEIAGIER